MTSDIAASKGFLSRLTVLTPDAYARAAVRWIGHGAVCMPNLVHRLQYWCIGRVVPDGLLNVLCHCENLRQRYLCQASMRETHNKN